jgi:hypothetical protein
MASFLAAGMQPATWLSAGMREAVFSSRLARTRATKHKAARAERRQLCQQSLSTAPRRWVYNPVLLAPPLGGIGAGGAGRVWLAVHACGDTLQTGVGVVPRGPDS